MRGRASLGGFLAVAALMVIAVTAAATGGPWAWKARSFKLFKGEGSFTPPPMPVPSAASPVIKPPIHHRTIALGWLPWIFGVIALLAVALVVWWLVRRYLRTAVPEPNELRGRATMTTGEATPELPVLRQGVRAAQRSLDDIADPNNAIVAAWLALEDAAASSGVARQAADTPTEFTIDVLTKTEADPDAASELLSLYHQARFSSHGVGRAEVVRAADCLGRLSASWTPIELPADPAT